MKIVKYAAIAGIVLFVILLVLVTFVPQEFFDRARREQEARNAPPAPRVEEGAMGRMVTFNTNGTPEPASLTITCEDGEPNRFMIKLDAPPPSPPPLRGVYGVFNFDKEPRQSFELSYGLSAMWRPREEQSRDVRDVVRRFAAGDDLSFSLAKPNGSGKTVTWKAVRPFKFCAGK